jgi:hypothetical protein
LSTSHEVIRELKSRHGAGALRQLADAAAGGDQFLRRTALEVIGRHPLGRDLQAVDEIWIDTDFPLACELAAFFSGPEILPSLSTLSEDIDGHVRKAASKAFQTVSSRACPNK